MILTRRDQRRRRRRRRRFSAAAQGQCQILNLGKKFEGTRRGSRQTKLGAHRTEQKCKKIISSSFFADLGAAWEMLTFLLIAFPAVTAQANLLSGNSLKTVLIS